MIYVMNEKMNVISSGHLDLNIPEELARNAFAVQADEHELMTCQMILQRKILGRVHIFVGDDAKEIILNWGKYK